MKYENTLNGLSMLLNQKGRSKKGFNRQEEFKKYLQVLKDDFGQEISTFFLFNLMQNNKSLSNRQKTHKIFNLTRGLNKEKRSLFLRKLEVMNYRTDIMDYSFKKGYTPKKAHLNREVKTKVKTTKKGTPYIFNCGEDIREIGQYIKEDIGITFDIKNIQIGKEFVASSKKTFNFLMA